jgi:homocysteine S-methyltransferase
VLVAGAGRARSACGSSPTARPSREEARAAFTEQIAALRQGGADCVILETFSDLIEIEQAIRAARDVDPAMPVIAQMTVGEDLRTPYGATPADVARALDAWGADVIGLNCSVGPQAILDAVEQMAAAGTRRKLSAMPNAGMPREVGGRRMYMASAEYFATYARHLVQAGAKVVGGCCGSTPEHVRAMCQALRVERAMERSEAAAPGGQADPAAGPSAGPSAAPCADGGTRRDAPHRWPNGRGWARSWRRGRS